MAQAKESTITQHFVSSTRWTIIGSVLYEALKLCHQLCLFKLLPLAFYGVMGTIFSIIYLTIHLTHLGAEHALPPFLATMIKSKNNFRRIFPWYLLPQLPLLGVGSIIASFWYLRLTIVDMSPTLLLVTCTLIVSEAIRMFLRAFLHAIFLHRPTTLIELGATLTYYVIVWTSYLFFHQPLSLPLLFVPYLLTSLGAVILFFYQVAQFYSQLPLSSDPISSTLWRQIATTRLQNYVIHLAKALYTGNFLVTFFASRFGFAQAGLFKCASYIADGMRAVIHSFIGFSGSALLAAVKERALATKQRAFAIISDKITKIIYLIVIALALNAHYLINAELNNYALLPAILPAILFLLLTFLDYWTIMYANFYTLEEQAGSAMLFKILEAALVIVILFLEGTFSPVYTLFLLVMVKLICFAIIATDAYHRWHLKPRVTPNWQFILGCFAFSITLRLVLAIIKRFVAS